MTARILTHEAFEASRKFIETTARPLEIARFRYVFTGGSVEAVFDALRRYQNSDGGFGHALEPDLRAPESSALSTSVAFQILRSTRTKPDQAFIALGIKYFLQTLNKTEGHWRIIPELAEGSPHAPWWNQTARGSEFDRFSLNPSAEILGYLYDYQELIPAGILSFLSDLVLSHLSDLNEIEMHELLCCMRLLQTETLPEGIYGPLKQKLTGIIPRTVACDPEQWSGYSLRPLQVVDDPKSPFKSMLEDAVATNLDYEISAQNRDGSWTPTWTWGGAYPDDWKIAQREWSGIITLDKLLQLKIFDRIEGIS